MKPWPSAVDTSALTGRPKVNDTLANVTETSALVGQDLYYICDIIIFSYRYVRKQYKGQIDSKI